MGKRLFDLTLASAILVPATILVLIAGMLVKVTSRGPTFFVQKRIGKEGKEFLIFKLRTLYVDTGSEKKFVDTEDSRVTPVGRFLRKTRIDEYPQILNVLLGHMSFVGPRPLTEETIRRILKKVPSFNDRLVVLPGITGLAQISRYVYKLGPRHTLQIDRIYIRKQSLLLDIWILLKDFQKTIFL